MRRLDGTDATQHVDDTALRALYAYPDDLSRPWMRINFVSSLDGAVAVEGRSGALGSPADKKVFGLLRELADVILVGAGTVRAENYGGARTSEALRVRREDGPDILTFTEAGGLARSGLNAAGIALTANFLESDLDYRKVGVPLPLIRRKILEQEHLALAMRAAYVTRKSGSNNMMISHAGGVALNFECAPDETFLLHPSGGLLVHANHWLSPIALGKLRDTGIASTPDTLYRDTRVRELLEPHRGKIDVSHIKAALLDDFASPWSVCRPPRLNLASNLSATVATLVMQPAALTMEVAALPAVNPEFSRYGFDD